VIEAGQRHLILGIERGEDLVYGRTHVGDLAAAFHAAAGVDQQQDPRRRHPGMREVDDLLRPPALEDLDLFRLQIADRSPLAVDSRSRHDDQIAFGAETRNRRVPPRRISKGEK
jgi:hypothetical protein